jgi:Tfp pilus assembly protein PilO
MTSEMPPARDNSIVGMNGPWTLLLKIFLAMFMPSLAIVLGACWWVVSKVSTLTTRVEVAQTERVYISQRLQDLRNEQKELEDVKKTLIEMGRNNRKPQ